MCIITISSLIHAQSVTSKKFWDQVWTCESARSQVLSSKACGSEAGVRPRLTHSVWVQTCSNTPVSSQHSIQFQKYCDETCSHHLQYSEHLTYSDMPAFAHISLLQWVSLEMSTRIQYRQKNCRKCPNMEDNLCWKHRKLYKAYQKLPVSHFLLGCWYCPELRNAPWPDSRLPVLAKMVGCISIPYSSHTSQHLYQSASQNTQKSMLKSWHQLAIFNGIMDWILVCGMFWNSL